MVRLRKNWLRAVPNPDRQDPESRRLFPLQPVRRVSAIVRRACNSSSCATLIAIRRASSFSTGGQAKPTGLPISCRCAVRHAKRHSATSCRFQVSVVVDQAQLSKLVHEKARARSPRTDHFRQCLLADLRYDRLGPILPKFASSRRARAKRFSLELNN
jgi:hypothetical protein